MINFHERVLANVAKAIDDNNNNNHGKDKSVGNNKCNIKYPEIYITLP